MLLEVSPLQALLWAILTPAVFIGSIFFRKPTKSHRNDPGEIKRRFIVIGAASVFWPSMMFLVFGKGDEGPWPSTWLGLDLSFNGYVSCLCSLAATLVLFSGPIYSLVFTEEAETDLDLAALRAYFVAPLYEELVFRSTLICPLLAAGFSVNSTIMLSAVIFGLSHLYHWFESAKRQNDIVNSLFQVTFTTIFGIYAAYIFTTTGSLYACVVTHSFCNFMGVPDLGFTQANHPGYRYRTSIIIVYLCGIIGFMVLCPLMLDPKLFLSWHSQLNAN